MRRLAAGGALAAALVVWWAPPALAHGIGGRSDLPLPAWMFAYGAAAVLVATFVGLSAFWRQPRLEGPTEPGLDLGPTGTGPRRALLVAGRALGLAALVLVAAAGLVGENTTSANLAPVAVYLVFWVGLQFTCALAGDLWRVLDPFDTLAAGVEALRRSPPARYRWGQWPAVAGLSGFLWLELVYPYRAEPRTVGTAVAVYTAAVVAATVRWGRGWLAQGEGFTVLFGLLGRMAPVGVDGRGHLRLRAPLTALPAVAVSPAMVALVCAVLGSTTFDGITRTRLWTDATADLGTVALAVVGTAGLAWSVAVVAIAWTGAMGITARLVGARGGTGAPATEQVPAGEGPDLDGPALGRRFAHSLVPIVFAYALAHYFSLLVFEGQAALARASDPFGRGWDLFGTAAHAVDFTLVSTSTVAYVQAGGIVVGHVAGVVLAHDRALALVPRARVARSQYPLLGVMVLYTVGGLALLMGT